MFQNAEIPFPVLFNPLKHYLPFIRRFIDQKLTDETVPDLKNTIKDLKHIGTSVMDIYTGNLSMDDIFREVEEFLKKNRLTGQELFASWTGTDKNDYRIITLSDNSRWTLKYHKHETRYVHLFPARLSPYTFRVKANTLKSAILYLIFYGKDFITEDDLNTARSLVGLSPVKDVIDTEAITQMIEILRN